MENEVKSVVSEVFQCPDHASGVWGRRDWLLLRGLALFSGTLWCSAGRSSVREPSGRARQRRAHLQGDPAVVGPAGKGRAPHQQMQEQNKHEPNRKRTADPCCDKGEDERPKGTQRESDGWTGRGTAMSPASHILSPLGYQQEVLFKAQQHWSGRAVIFSVLRCKSAGSWQCFV